MWYMIKELPNVTGDSAWMLALAVTFVVGMIWTLAADNFGIQKRFK